MEFLPYLSSLSALAYVPLLVVTSYVILYYLVYWRRTTQWRKSNIPFLPPSFLIGHKYFWNMINNSWLDPIDRIYKENKDKDVVGFFMATLPVVLIRNPAHIRQMFVKNFDKGIGVSHDDELAQHMLGLSSDKELWKSDRKTLAPMFTTSRVSGEQFAKITDQIHSMWTHGEQTRLRGEPLNITQASIKFLFDGLSKSFFNLDANSHEEDGLLLEIAHNSAEPSLINTLKSVIKLRFNGAQVGKSRPLLPQDTAEAMKKMVERQMEERTTSKSNATDFIDLLIKLKDEKEDGKASTEVDITNQIVGFGFSLLFGSSAKARLTLNGGQNVYLPSSAVHLLSLHPEHQERIRREVEETMKKHNTTEFTYEVVQDLQFLRQCIYEAARLYPTVITLSRVCGEDFKLPGTEYTFKKGERVIMDPYSIHHDPKYYKDPEKFNPDRFSPENKDTIAPETYLAFGSGPRKCPGKNLAFLMLSALIGSLVYKYEVKPRSHLRQMDISDFHPRSLGLRAKDDVLVDVVPRDVTVC